MIEKLTDEQAALLPRWRDEWLRIGLSCEPCDFEKAKTAASVAYRSAGLKPPRLWLLMDCPITAAMAAAVLKHGDQVVARVRDQVWAQVWAQVWTQVRAQVWDQVRDQVMAQVWDQVWDRVGTQVRDRVWTQVRDQVGTQVRAQVGTQVMAQVWAQVRAQVGTQVRAQVGTQVRDQVWDQVRDQVMAQVWDLVVDQVFGSHDAGLMSWLDYFDRVVGLECTEPARGLIELAKYCGWWAPYKDLCILQHRHCELHRDTENRLHNEAGAAVLYRSGFGVWALHGVRVPKWLVETPAESLDPLEFAKLENAEIRREFVRKIGVERLCQKLGTELLDQRGDYELHLVDLKGETGKHPYLKMRNPSIGVFHMEAVSKECRTVEQALNFRNGGPLEHIAPLS